MLNWKSLLGKSCIDLDDLQTSLKMPCAMCVRTCAPNNAYNAIRNNWPIVSYVVSSNASNSHCSRVWLQSTVNTFCPGSVMEKPNKLQVMLNIYDCFHMQSLIRLVKSDFSPLTNVELALAPVWQLAEDVILDSFPQICDNSLNLSVTSDVWPKYLIPASIWFHALSTLCLPD